MTQADDESGENRFRRVLEAYGGVCFTEGNSVERLHNGVEIFPAMLDAIARAEHRIDFVTFIYWTGNIAREMAAALAERARAGVAVHILLDALGARTMERGLIHLMEERGVQVHWFRPLHRFRPGQVNHRTHRKVMIVDEAVGFTGGVGIADEWKGDARDEHEWRDTHFRLEGPIVDGLRAAFLDNWAETEAELYEEGIDRFPEQPQAGTAVTQCIRGASETGWSDTATLARTLLQLAEERVRITTAYFVPDDELTRRLCDASDRGVAVDVLIPGPHADKRVVQMASEASYARLLEHGVTIWNYQPTMIHAKLMTVDGLVANIGSANLNRRSCCLDEEINVVALESGLVAVLDAQFEEDLDRSVRIRPGRWDRRSLAQQTVERMVKPIRRFF